MTTHTTRELMILAAKAAGYDPVRITDDGCVLLRGVQVKWNPRHDERDALRLAVVLNIHLCLEDGVSSAYPAGDLTKYKSVPHGDDKFGATCLAILLVASAIGEAMP